MLSKLFRRQSREPVVETESSLQHEDKLWNKGGGRGIDTRRFGVNMPKHQPCPEGHGWKKRKSKAAGGARYWCNRCQGFFFVRAPRL